MMNHTLALAQGAAHAFLFGILVLAGTGKLVGCLTGGRTMCAKAGLDLGLALAACLVFWPPVTYFVAVLAIGIAVFGWLGEIVRKSKVCNCFGVLTNMLEPWRNVARAGMIASGSALLLLGLMSDHGSQRNDTAMALGAVLGLAIMLVFSAWAFARAVQMKKPRVIVLPDAAPTAQAITLSTSTVLGQHADGTSAVLGELIKTGKPLVLLLSSRRCSQCQSIKEELEPLLGEFPFPLHAIIEGEANQQGNHRQTLFDPGGSLRRSLGIIGVPSMVVIDTASMTLAQPVSAGPEAIRSDLIRLFLKVGERQPGAQIGI